MVQMLIFQQNSKFKGISMVKKVLIILSICFFIFSCTVNDNTGLIVFTNRSQSNLSFKFNSTDIGKLENGKTLDYWYFNNMSGNLNVSSSYLIYTFVADYYDESNETIHYSKNNLRESKKNYEKALIYNQGNIDAQFYIALINEKLKDWRNASLAYKKVIELAGGDSLQTERINYSKKRGTIKRI